MKQTQEADDTYLFIDIVLKWWKILNVKQKGLEIRNSEPLQSVVSSVNDERLTYIENFGSTFLLMAGLQGKKLSNCLQTLPRLCTVHVKEWLTKLKIS